jgi:hypothetical protein
MTSTSTIILQQATAHDDAALREVSQLDSARVIARPALMAIVDGRLVAAVSLDDGRIVADPFVATEEAVRLLRLRRHTLKAGARERRRSGRRALRLRLRPAA